jgi:hypothetical protein
MLIQYIEMIESGSKLCILQHTKNLGEFVISLIISAKKLSSQKYRYCIHLCRIDRLFKLVISDYGICIFARIGVTSTYLYFGGICDIFRYHRF